MQGWKTKVAALGTACTGVAMAISGVAGDAVDPDKVWQGILIINGALAVIGIGHKIEKSS